MIRPIHSFATSHPAQPIPLPQSHSFTHPHRYSRPSHHNLAPVPTHDLTSPNLETPLDFDSLCRAQFPTQISLTCHPAVPFRSSHDDWPIGKATHRNAADPADATQTQHDGHTSGRWVSTQDRLADLTASTPLSIALFLYLSLRHPKELVLLVARYFTLAFSARSLLVSPPLKQTPLFPTTPFTTIPTTTQQARTRSRYNTFLIDIHPSYCPSGDAFLAGFHPTRDTKVQHRA